MKLKNPELEVVRFDNEDVIATSGEPLKAKYFGFDLGADTHTSKDNYFYHWNHGILKSFTKEDGDTDALVAFANDYLNDAEIIGTVNSNTPFINLEGRSESLASLFYMVGDTYTEYNGRYYYNNGNF